MFYSSYPTAYINTQFQYFFKKYLPSYTSILPLINNTEDFSILRQQLLAQPTIKQIVVNKSAASIDLRSNNADFLQDNPITRDKKNKFENNIFIHCTHEGRLKGLKRSIHEIHDEFFKTTNYADIRLIVGHQNNPNIEFELAQKRPNSSLFKNQPIIKSKILIYFFILSCFIHLEVKLNPPPSIR